MQRVSTAGSVASLLCAACRAGGTRPSDRTGAARLPGPVVLMANSAAVASRAAESCRVRGGESAGHRAGQVALEGWADQRAQLLGCCRGEWLDLEDVAVEGESYDLRADQAGS
jgi:hypothetical protein